ncbi:uncharacterized protein TNCV_4213461 [Trichonephila clavipes]|nr:uncharacterized protein TNCV_4213461 [Trichonephila clavipes]
MQKFPNVKSISSGKHIKLNTDCHEDYTELTDFMDEDRDIEFYVIKPKESKPIKVVVKGLPGCTETNEIISDLEDQGYTVDSVNQLISKRTKLELPFLLITMPRNEFNLTVFDLTHLGFMQVKIKGYSVHGTTQCFNCNNFFHTAANCHMITRCLKCGKEHLTKDCDIKERQDCINCNAYGHTACYTKCPNFPKPRKGSPLVNRNSKKFTSNNVVEGISFANMGLATELLICCEFCGLIQPLLNTRFTNTVVNKKDTKVYEVNTRLAYAMRSVGKGEAAAKVFCGVMNLPPPPKRFYESLHALNNATEKVAKVSMALAAAETLSFNNGNPNVPVAIDGTWQKRGHTSLNGVVTAVSVDTGKVIDAEILSRKCSCHFNGNLHSDECSANYFGNSGGMEVEGALRIFNRSEVLHNLKYTQYLGDGDSKAYKAVLESKPYKDVNIEKLECVGHVEKRMGLITKLKVLDLLNIQPGFYTCRALQEADHARIRKAEKAISRRTIESRIKNRQLKCRQEDDLADDLSNPSYGSVQSSLIQSCSYFQPPRTPLVPHVLATSLQPPNQEQQRKAP